MCMYMLFGRRVPSVGVFRGEAEMDFLTFAPTITCHSQALCAFVQVTTCILVHSDRHMVLTRVALCTPGQLIILCVSLAWPLAA